MADKKPAQRFWRRFGIAAAVILAGVIAVFAGQAVSGLFVAPLLLAPFDGLDDMPATLASYVITQAIVVALLIGVAYLFKAKAAELGVVGKMKNWTYLLLLPLIYVATLIAGAVVTLVIAYFIPSYDAAQPQNLGFPTNDQNHLVAVFLLLVVAAPLVEEFIYRGYLFGLLRRVAPFWVAAIIASAIFGIAHWQWNVGINVFILSLALCFIREKTGSIWTGVGLHALKNFVAFLLLFVYNVA